MDQQEYSDLYNTSHKGYKVTPPEEEKFKSVYIGGEDRKNHIGIVEKKGKLHVRGFKYNLDQIIFLITHVKGMLAKTERDDKLKRDVLKCFSYQLGKPPWIGTSGKTCGTNSAERASVDFCAPCRSQLVVSGILCDDKGNFIEDDRKELVRIFIRAKASKYGLVKEYLDKCTSMDIDPPFFTPQTTESKKAEKDLVNNKRMVTVVTIGSTKTNYGMKDAFRLSEGSRVPLEVTKKVLDDAKKTLSDFNEKFDWSKTKQAVGYGSDSDKEDEESEKPPLKPEQLFEEAPKPTLETTTVGKPEEKGMFEDLAF